VRPRVLVAGIGNIFLGDDGFGVEVVRRLATRRLPEWVHVADYGIAGMHLAYDLLGGYRTTILVDATARGREPGTVCLIELDPPAGEATRSAGEGKAATKGAGGTGPRRPLDAHGMQPEAVLELLELLGGDAGRVLVVGCEPADVGHRIGLSAPVSRAVDEAVRLVHELIDMESAAIGAVGAGAEG
jgi:hydrogenase maturation protease